MAKQLEKLVIKLEADSARLQKQLDASNKKIKRWEKKAKGSVSSVGRSFVKLAATIGALKIGKEVISIAIEFERLKVTLESITGSAETAKLALGFLRDFAATTPFQVRDLAKSFILLQNFGLTPTAKTMRALTDQAANLGGSSEMLTGIILQLGQAWGKTKLQGQEVRVLLERGVPVYKLLSKAMDLPITKIKEMQEAGELGRESITLLIDEMGRFNAGGAAAQADTLGGSLSNLADKIDSVVDKITNREGGLTGELARLTRGFTAIIGEISGTSGVGDLNHLIGVTQERVKKLQQSIFDNQKSGSFIPPRWINDVTNLQKRLVELGERRRKLLAEADVRANKLEETLGGGGEVGGGETKQERMARERADKALVRQKEQALKQIEILETSQLDIESREIDSWFRRQEMLDNALNIKAISEDYHRTLSENLEEQHMTNLANIRKKEDKRREDAEKRVQNTINQYRMHAVQQGVALLQVFAGESKAAAIAVLLIQKGLAIAEVRVNTEAAAARALAELGYIAGTAAAARIRIAGAVSIGLIAATGVAQAVAIGSGGASFGTPANPISTTSEGQIDQDSPGRQTHVTVNVTGNIYADDLDRILVDAIRTSVNDLDEVIIDSNSRQARELSAA